MSGASKFFVGGDHTGATDNGRMKPITGIRYILSDDNEIFVGDETGTVLTQECPYATQAMAEAALKRLKGYEYQMASVEAAGLDPAAELGDGVAAGGVYFALSRISDDGEGFPNLTAPGEEELEDEYPTNGEGPLTTQLRQKISNNYSAIIRTDNEIRQIVADVNGQFTSVNQRVDGVETTITSVDGRVTTIKDTIDGITVTGEGGTAYIKPGAIQANSITGSMIAGETITADNIAGGAITANKIEAGSIGTQQLNSESLNIGNGKFVLQGSSLTIKDCDITLQDSAVKSKMLQDDAVTEKKIMDGAVTAGKINARGLTIGPDRGPAEFTVDENGHVQLGANATISFGGDVTSNNIADKVADAAKAGTDAAGDVKALANGTYTQPGVDVEKTFISNKQIRSAEIMGGVIRGAEFTNLDGTGLFKVETYEGYATFSIGNNVGSPAIQLSSDIGRTTIKGEGLELYGCVDANSVGGRIKLGNTTILTHSETLNDYRTYPRGIWDFSNTNVKNLPGAGNFSSVSHLTSDHKEFYCSVYFAGFRFYTPVYPAMLNQSYYVACSAPKTTSGGADKIYGMTVEIDSDGYASVGDIYSVGESVIAYSSGTATIYAR